MNARAAFKVDAEVADPGNVPAEVLSYWRQKGLKVGFDFRDVWREEHHYSFTVAKVMREDVLAAMHDELGKAFEEGLTFRSFVQSMKPRMEALGWWGEHEVTDPVTGKVVKVNPPARLARIYQTNMRTARAVGQWERIQRSAKSRPYLLYTVGPSARHREQHLAWHGILLPVDDDFWRIGFPPNGWGCKCRVRAVSKREADELDKNGVPAPDPEPIIDPATGLPTGHVVNRRVPVVRTAPELQLVPWHNKRTGNIEFVPKGIDPGFDRSPAVNRDRAIGGGSTPPPANDQTKPTKPANDQTKPDPTTHDYWLPVFRDKYGDNAGKAVAWGRAAEERGLELTIKKAEALTKKRVQPSTGADAGDDTLFDFTRAHTSESVRNAKTMRELVEGLEAELAAGRDPYANTDFLKNARALAALVGHADAIDAHGKLPYKAPTFADPGYSKDSKKNMAKRLDRGLDIYRHLGDESIKHVGDYEIVVKHGERAYHIYTRDRARIVVGSPDDTQVFAHEVGHALEHHNVGLHYRAQDFLKARTKGEEARKLSELVPGSGYGDHEVARRDQFMDPYIGKDYGDRASEVTSMGVEAIVAGLYADFRDRDAEHFWFILGQLAGGKI